MKFSRICVLTTMMLGMSGAAGAQAPGPAGTWPEIRLTSRHWAPYHFADGPTITGPGVDAAGCAMKALNAKFKVESFPFIRAQKMVADGEADGFFLASRTPERDEFAVLSAPISRSIIRWYTLKDSSADPMTNKSLAVATIRGSNGAQTLEREGYVNAARLATAVEVLKMLFAKRVEAVMLTQSTADEAFASGAIDGTPDMLKSVKYSENGLGIYFGKTFLAANPGFLEAFNKVAGGCFIDVMKEDSPAPAVTQ